MFSILFLFLFQAFGGEGNRLDGKKKLNENQPSPAQNNIIRRYVFVFISIKSVSLDTNFLMSE